MRRMRRDESGATAVEYGLIAGLIAIGIVGSLVTTRGSLNSVFSTAGAQMASSTSTAAVTKPPYTGPTFNPALARAPFWSAKTLSSGPTIDKSNSGYSQVTAKFTDGSQVYYTKYNDGRQQITVYDGSTLYAWAITTTAAGVMNYSEYDHYTSSAFTNMDVYYYGGNYNAAGTPTTMTTVHCNGGCTSSSGSPSDQFVTSYQNAFGDIAVYDDILTR